MYSKAIRITTQLIIISQLLFLPGLNATFGMDSSFKLFIFGLLVLGLLFFIFLRMIHKNELVVNRSGIMIAILCFSGTVLLSAMTGLDKSLSMFGGDINIGYSFVYLLYLLTFFFIVITYYQTKDNISFLFRTFIYTYTVLIAACYLSFLSYLFNFPFTPVLENAIKLSVGSYADLAMYVSVISVFVFAVSINDVGAKLLFPNHDALKYLRALLFFSFLILIVINFLPAWITLLAGMVFVLFVYRMVNKSSGWEVVAKKELIKKMIYVFLVVFFLILNLSNISNQIFERQLNKNLKLSYQKSLSVVTESLKDKPLLGNGGEVFRHVFSRYRGEEMNVGAYWNIRYMRSISYFLEMISSFGILGVIPFVVFLLFVARSIYITIDYTVKKYAKGGNISQLGILLGIAGTLVSLILAHFVYSANMLLIFVFILFLSFLFVYNKSLGIHNKLLNNFKTISKTKKPKLFYFLLGKMFILFVVLIVLSVYSFKIVLASVYFDNLELNEDRLKKIITLNSNNHLYELQLASFYKNRIVREVSRGEERDDERIKYYYKNLEILSAVLSEKKSSSVAVQEAIGKTYFDLEKTIPGSYRLSVEYYHKAIELEPSNPILLNNLAQAYLYGEEKEKAEHYLRKALEKKKDYSEAKFNLAKHLGDMSRVEEAVGLLNELSGQQYRMMDVYYEIGRAYFNNDDTGLAIENFEKVILISPNHSNALYSLAISYEKLGDNGKARHYFNKVLQLNPNSEEIENRLNNIDKISK